MEIISIGSSSSGNSYIVKVGEANFILDVGLSAKKILAAMESVEMRGSDIDAIFITHEHIDHIRSIRTIAKKCPEAKLYMSRGTYEACDSLKELDDERIHFVSANEQIWIIPKNGENNAPSVKISCFSLSHDAKEPLGFSFEEVNLGKSLCVVTDTGIVTDEIFEAMKSADNLVFEANHEENLLMMGEYPYHVKMRIKSDYGHLSNVACGECIARLLESRESSGELNVMLAHLSEKNNTPYQARLTIEDILREKGYERDKDYYLTIAAKEGLTKL